MNRASTRGTPTSNFHEPSVHEEHITDQTSKSWAPVTKPRHQTLHEPSVKEETLMIQFPEPSANEKDNDEHQLHEPIVNAESIEE